MDPVGNDNPIWLNVALSEQNELTIRVPEKDGSSSRFLTRNRQTRGWEARMPESPAQLRRVWLLGYDGETLVTTPLPATTGAEWALRRYQHSENSEVGRSKK